MRQARRRRRWRSWGRAVETAPQGGERSMIGKAVSATSAPPLCPGCGRRIGVYEPIWHLAARRRRPAHLLARFGPRAPSRSSMAFFGTPSAPSATAYPAVSRGAPASARPSEPPRVGSVPHVEPWRSGWPSRSSSDTTRRPPIVRLSPLRSEPLASPARRWSSRPSAPMPTQTKRTSRTTARRRGRRAGGPPARSRRRGSGGRDRRAREHERRACPARRPRSVTPGCWSSAPPARRRGKAARIHGRAAHARRAVPDRDRAARMAGRWGPEHARGSVRQRGEGHEALRGAHALARLAGATLPFSPRSSPPFATTYGDMPSGGDVQRGQGEPRSRASCSSLGEPALLGAIALSAGSAVNRDAFGERLAHRLAVLVALGDREHLQVGLHRVGDRVQQRRPLGG